MTALYSPCTYWKIKYFTSSFAEYFCPALTKVALDLHVKKCMSVRVVFVCINHSFRVVENLYIVISTRWKIQTVLSMLSKIPQSTFDIVEYISVSSTKLFYLSVEVLLAYSPLSILCMDFFI